MAGIVEMSSNVGDFGTGTSRLATCTVFIKKEGDQFISLEKLTAEKSKFDKNMSYTALRSMVVAVDNEEVSKMRIRECLEEVAGKCDEAYFSGKFREDVELWTIIESASSEVPGLRLIRLPQEQELQFELSMADFAFGGNTPWKLIGGAFGGAGSTQVALRAFNGPAGFGGYCCDLGSSDQILLEADEEQLDRIYDHLHLLAVMSKGKAEEDEVFLMGTGFANLAQKEEYKQFDPTITNIHECTIKTALGFFEKVGEHLKYKYPIRYLKQITNNNDAMKGMTLFTGAEEVSHDHDGARLDFGQCRIALKILGALSDAGINCQVAFLKAVGNVKISWATYVATERRAPGLIPLVKVVTANM